MRIEGWLQSPKKALRYLNQPSKHKEQTMSEIMIVSRTVKDAFASKSNADQLLANPAAVLQRNGFDIPEGKEKEFNNYFNEVAGDIVTRLRETPENRLSAVHEELVQRGIGCTACKIGVYTIAAAIVAVGAAGIASLTTGSSVVVALASFAGVSARVALTFIRGLGRVISSGVRAVAQRICEWTGAC
jgi:hypothetical protein